MEAAVTIKDGYYTVDAHAWINQRIGDGADALTDSLRMFLDAAAFTDYHPHMGTGTRMQLWCAARDWTVGEGMPIYHDGDGLDAAITVVLAVDPARCAYALVQVGTDEPDVYRDITTDDAYWYQTAPVDIVCPGEHRWTWLDRTSLLDEHGTYIPFTDLFGSGWGAPYSTCRDCVAYDDGEREEPCPCDNPTVIYCPTCGERCELRLTAVATVTQPERQS